MGSGRGEHGKENPREYYAVGLRTEPARLVRGSSRRITIMRLRPANIRVINRRENSSTATPTASQEGKEKSRKTVALVDGSFHISTAIVRAYPRSPTRHQNARVFRLGRSSPVEVMPAPTCAGFGSM